MTIARVSGNAVIETRELDLSDIPVNKRYLWLAVTGTEPSYDAAFQTISDMTYTVGEDEVVRTWVVANVDITELKATKIEAAFVHMNTLLETVAAANVSVDGGYHLFGCDSTSRENIMGINTAIVSGVPIANPRTWLPKGEFVPVSVTYTDLATIGGATLAKVDEYFQQYFIHKGTIAASSNLIAIAIYNYTTGYDSL